MPKLRFKTAAWSRSEGKAKSGGLNQKGRDSYKAQTGGTLKAPVKSGDNPRRASFLARMGGMPGPEYKDGKPTRLLLSLRAWAHHQRQTLKQRLKTFLNVIKIKNNETGQSYKTR